MKPPIVRGQMPAREPSLLKLPAPDELGIRLGDKEKPLDWDLLRQQLDRLGAGSFQLEKQGTGYRFACQLPSGAVEGGGAALKPKRCAWLWSGSENEGVAAQERAFRRLWAPPANGDSMHLT